MDTTTRPSTTLAMAGGAFLILAGYFIVHFFEHTVAPHFHFGEETHHEHHHDRAVAVSGAAGHAGRPVVRASLAVRPYARPATGSGSAAGSG